MLKALATVRALGCGATARPPRRPSGLMPARALSSCHEYDRRGMRHRCCRALSSRAHKMYARGALRAPSLALHLVFTWGPRPRAGRSWGRAILIREFVAACFSKVLRCRPFLLLQDRDETSERQPDRHKELKVRRPRPARGRAAVIIYKFMLRTVPHATRLHRVSGLSPGPRPTGQSLISRSRPALTPPPALRPVPPQKTRAFPV